MIIRPLTKSQINIREVSPADFHELASLLHFESFVHRHLDWRGPLDWINQKPFLVAELRGTLIGALACPVDLPGLAWIQVFAVKPRLGIESIWNPLWKETLVYHQNNGDVILAAIATQPWFSGLLEKSRFTHAGDVVVLMRNQPNLPPPDFRPDIIIREMTLTDLDAVHLVDQASFELLWQQSPVSLQIALQQACFATVAELHGKVIGYQISTSGHLGGHLARLAVHPEHRGEHVGYALVYDVLEKFARRSIFRVTVNTQQENIISQQLYKRFGFQTTGETFQVFTLSSAKTDHL